MKNISTFLLLFFLSISFCNGQSIKKIIKLSSEIYDLITEGEINQAIANSHKVYSTYPNYLIDQLHSNISQSINRNDKNAHLYVEELSRTENNSLKSIVFPMYVWSQAKKQAPTSNVSRVIENLNQVLNSSDYASRSDRYAYLTLSELMDNNLISTKKYELYLKKCIVNLTSQLEINTELEENENKKALTWRRFLLSYFYYDLYKLTSTEKFLEKASFYSLNQNDKKYDTECFYDNILFSGSTKIVNHKITYYKFLKETNQTEKALALLKEIIFIYPSRKNLGILKNQYDIVKKEESFEEFWFGYFNQKANELPQKNKIFNIDLTGIPKSYQNYWILIDVWGTWCKPCLEELPELQNFYVDNLKNKNSKLKIHTFSYASTGLKKFMKKRKYTFPVFEVDKAIIDLLQVNSFPTKFLISPEGKFITLSEKNWRSYTENYTLISSQVN